MGWALAISNSPAAPLSRAVVVARFYFVFSAFRQIEYVNRGAVPLWQLSEEEARFDCWSILILQQPFALSICHHSLVQAQLELFQRSGGMVEVEEE